MAEGEAGGKSAAAEGGKSYRANAAWVQVYQGLNNLSLWMPIYIIFLQTQRHMSLAAIYTMTGVTWLVTAFANVPAGAVADRFGRKATLMVGTVLVGIGITTFGLASQIPVIVAAFLIWGVGNAFQAGTDMALIFDSVSSSTTTSQYPRIAGRSFQILQAAQAGGSIAGAWLASRIFSLPIIVTGVLTFIALGTLLRVREPPREHSERRGYLTVLGDAVRFVAQRPRLLPLMLFTALLAGVAFMPPFVLFQPYMASHSVPVAWFGVLYTVLRLAAVAGSRYGPRIVKEETLFFWLAVVPPVLAVAFVVVGLSQIWWIGFPAMLVAAAVCAGVRPHLSHRLNEQVPPSVRATLLSLEQVVMTLIIAGLQPPIGVLTDRYGTIAAFALLAVVSLFLIAARALMPRTATAAPVSTA